MAVLYMVAAWFIMQVAEVVTGLADLPDWIGPAILGLLAIGFPIALIFSWFYELTPEGISLEKDVDRADSITHITGRRLDFIVISLLCAAVILFAYDKWWMHGPPEKSIAVLPFDNMSDDPGQDYFSDGISEELLNVLSKLPGLRVVARTSSFQFKGENLDIIKIGQQLNAAFVLEGSVRKAGPQVRITTQLIDASNGFHLWSETYDRELENIFAVQDEISAAIVASLKEHLGLRVEAAPQVIAAANPEAHDAFLRGRYLVAQRTVPGVENAVREFEKAVALDPDYALAHAELATAALILAHYDALTLNEAIATATLHTERAMALDPTLAEVHAATGLLSGRQENPEEALTHFRRAIQINPNYSSVFNWMAAVLDEKLGRYEEAFVATETAVHLDPLSIPAVVNYVRSLIIRNRLAEADREMEKLASIAPSFYAIMRGDRTSLGGKWADRVLGNLDAWQINRENSRSKDSLAWQFAVLGLEEEALDISEDPASEMLSLLGKHTDAVATAEARLAEGPMSMAARIDLGITLAGAGDYARARPILEDLWQRSGGRVTRFGWFDTNSAAALIAIRRNAGEEAEVGELVAAMRDNVRRYHVADMTVTSQYFSVDYEDGLAAYLAGESQRGLALIAKGAEEGYFILPNHAYLHALYDDPAFILIRTRQEARQTRERKRFLAIVCTENPYAAVWQPAKETCERYALAGTN
jgi:TolB-like protein